MKDWIVELADENTGDLVKVYVTADSKEDAIDGAWFELSEEGEDVNNYTLIDAYSNLHLLYAISKDGKIYSGNNYEDIILNKPINFFSKDDSIKGYIDKKGKFYDEDGNSFESGGSVHEYTDDIWSFEAKVSDVNFYYEESWVKNMLPENSQIEFVKGENFKVKYRNVIDINPEGIDGGTPYIEEVSGTVVVEYSLREDEDLEIIELDFKTDADWNLKVLRNKGCIATTIDSLEINFKNKEVEVDFAGDSKGEWDSYEEGGLFNYLSTPITYQVFNENEIVLRTQSFNKAVDYRTLNGKHLKIVAIDKNGNSKVIASKEYANGGGIGKNKYQQASDYWKQLESQMTLKQKKFYSELLKRRLPKYEENMNDQDIANYINGEIIEQFGEDLGITKYQISGVNWFKLGFKYIAYREAIEHPEFWEEMKEYAKGGGVEDDLSTNQFKERWKRAEQIAIQELKREGKLPKTYAKGGGVSEIQSEITKEELESKLGRKLNGWNDDRVEYNGVTYVKCFLKPHYRIA